MSPHAFIFIGRPGSGKGTQSKLLEQFLRAKDPHREIFVLETGAKIRAILKEPGYTQDLARDIAAKELTAQPAFLAIWTWAGTFIEKLTPDEHVIIDGTPRSYPEAIALDTALKFYGRTTYIIYLDTTDESVEARLLERARTSGRADDTLERIHKRLVWFKRDVFPILDFYKNNPDYHFLDINGGQSIEGVHKDIITAIDVS